MAKKEKYTIVPVSEYKDNSTMHHKVFEQLFELMVALRDMEINITIPIKKEIEKDGFETYTMQSLCWGRGTEIVKKENGDLAVKTIFYQDYDNPKSKKKVILYDYSQEHFPQFIMPLFKYFKKLVINEKLKAFFLSEYFKKPRFSRIVTDYRRILFKKNIVVKDQKYEEAARLRDKEKELLSKIEKYILPKIKQFTKQNPDYFDYDLNTIIQEFLPIYI